jgi:hypothetical protein
VDARPILTRVAALLAKHRLEAVLIGNAAAALQGAPVTTLDLDFMFRQTPTNMKKLKAFAADLGASILRPYYPVSQLFRVMREDDALQIDFMPVIHGVRSYSSLKSRARELQLAGSSLLVADLADIIRSKRAANRPRDRAVLDVLEAALDEQKKRKT